MKTSKIIFGILGLLVGAALVSGSLSILVHDRDADDFFVSEEQRFERSSVAIVSENVEVLEDAPGWLVDWLTDPVDIRVRGARADGQAIFFGIADTGDLEAYLAGASYDEVTSIDLNGDDVRYETREGAASPAVPDQQQFWVASVSGPGEQTLDWSLESGNWSVVLMNANAAAGIDADVVFGAKISNVVLLSWIGLALGIGSLLGGAWTVYRGTRRTQGPTPPPQEPQPPASTTEAQLWEQTRTEREIADAWRSGGA